MKTSFRPLLGLVVAVAVVFLCSGCAVDAGYVDTAPVGAGAYFGSYGPYAGPYYGGYGPYYGSSTVVIGGGYHRGYYGGHHLYSGRYSAYRGGFGGRGFRGRGHYGGGYGRGRVLR